MKNINRLIYLLALVRFIIPFVLVPSFYELHRDEYLYWSESFHLAWGYMEVPPMLSILAYISNILGSHPFWLKLWPGLAGSACFILTARMAVSLGGKRLAVWLCFFSFVLTGYIRLFYLFHPNFLDVFFWTLSAYAIFFFIRTQENKWLYLLGIAVGLGMMSKYSMAFYVAALLMASIFTPHRNIFTNKHLYGALVVAFLIFLPNLLWQYNHLFPIVTHMQELQEEQLQFVSPITFIIGQLLMLLPCLFLWLRGLYFAGISKEGKQYMIFALAYVFVISLLIIGHGKDYYALGTYPILLALGTYQFEQYIQKNKAWWRYTPVAICFIIGLITYPILLPIAKPEKLAAYYKAFRFEKTGVLTWEDRKVHALPQDFGDMIGWKNLAEKTAAVFKSLSAEEQAHTLIYCRGYYSAGALNYHAKALGLPQIHSDNASFLWWMPEKYNINNLILVAHQIPDSSDTVFNLFEKRTVRDSSTLDLFREKGMKIILYENGKDSLNITIEKGIAAKKALFTRQ
jgi:hypothetical protein